MILSAVIMLVLATILLAYVLEPVLRAHVDRIEIDTAAETPPIPDFRTLLEEDNAPPTPVRDDVRQPSQEPEPAEHRS